MTQTATTPRLTEHQARVLSIVEAGRERGVHSDSVFREERAEGRYTNDIGNTLQSLVRRGLVVRTNRTETRLDGYGGKPRLVLHTTYTAASL